MKQRHGARMMSGIAALEFSFIAVLALFLLFGVLNFGAIFLVKQSLTRAANEGGLALMTSQQRGRMNGETDVCAVVHSAASVLNAWRDERGLPPLACTVQGAEPCSYDPASLCVDIVVAYPDYGQYPMVPAVVPLNAWMSRVTGHSAGWLVNALEGRTTVQLSPDLSY
ncbi:MAG: pilus assembly protein [Pigmentiphaga sp.]|nr:pilus assembly protein [Pigmentiphaga sp.]